MYFNVSKGWFQLKGSTNGTLNAEKNKTILENGGGRQKCPKKRNARPQKSAQGKNVTIFPRETSHLIKKSRDH